MRYNEIIESADDDDDLFGRGLHHRIAAALLAQAEEDQRIADEERGLGDQIHRNVQNADEFEAQARNYRYIADAFNQSMAQGVKVYRSLDRSWKGAVDDVVDIELDMDFRDYVKQIPESADDDDLFSTSPKLDRRQELKAKAIRRIEKRDALNIQPGTRLMVKWDNGKYYKGKVVRLTPSGRVIAQVKFHNVGWPLEKNISPRDIKPEHILKETDDDMFAKNSQMSQDIKTKLKQIDDPYLRTVRKIRELAKTKYGAKIRVSGAPKTSARGRATVWVGDYDANYQIPKTTPEAYAVKNDLEQMGFECRFTDAGWLSVKVPPVFSDLISEESDDELFGQEDGARLALKLLKLLRAAVARDPRGVGEMLKQYSNENSTLAQRVDYTLDYMAQAVGMPREIFDKYADDFFILPWPTGVDINRPWQIWDTQVLDRIIETMRRVVYGRDMNESDNDDDLFSHSVHEEVIYRVEEYKKGLEKHLEVVQQADPEDAEYLEDVINDVNQVLAKLQKNWIEGMDALLQASDSEDWAENIMHELKADNIPVSKYYRAPWLREDADDDELFGKTTLADRVADLIKHKQRVRILVPGAMGFVRAVFHGSTAISRSMKSTTRYAWPGLHGERANGLELVQNPATRTWDIVERDQAVNMRKYTEDIGDDELFGSDSSGMKGIIYRTGRQMLLRLEQSWNDPAVQREYKEYLEAGDDDAMFDQVVRLTRVQFKHAFVVDTILREFTTQEGLNDFGWMLDSGEFQDLVDAWERFREDADIENEPWFQREVQDFKGER